MRKKVLKLFLCGLMVLGSTGIYAEEPVDVNPDSEENTEVLDPTTETSSETIDDGEIDDDETLIVSESEPIEESEEDSEVPAEESTEVIPEEVVIDEPELEAEPTEEEETLVVQAMTDLGKYRVKKVSRDSQTPLSGAQFTLYTDSECTTAYQTVTTNEAGYAEFSQLAGGNYWLRETQAPDGYQYDPTVYPITIVGQQGEVIPVTDSDRGVTAVEFSSWDNMEPTDIAIEHLGWEAAEKEFSTVSGQEDFVIQPSVSGRYSNVVLRNSADIRNLDFADKWIKLTWRDAATTADGQTWDIVATISNFNVREVVTPAVETGIQGITVIQAGAASDPDYSDTVWLCSTAETTGYRVGLSMDVDVTIEKDGTPTTATATNLYFRDIDVAKTDNRIVPEAIELLGGLNSGRLYLNDVYENGQRWVRFENNYSYITANLTTPTSGDAEFNTGFITSVNPKHFSFRWYGGECGTGFELQSMDPTVDLTVENDEAEIPDLAELKILKNTDRMGEGPFTMAVHLENLDPNTQYFYEYNNGSISSFISNDNGTADVSVTLSDRDYVVFHIPLSSYYQIGESAGAYRGTYAIQNPNLLRGVPGLPLTNNADEALWTKGQWILSSYSGSGNGTGTVTDLGGGRSSFKITGNTNGKQLNFLQKNIPLEKDVTYRISGLARCIDGVSPMALMRVYDYDTTTEIYRGETMLKSNGTWMIVEGYFTPDHDMTSDAICFGLGTTGSAIEWTDLSVRELTTGASSSYNVITQSPRKILNGDQVEVTFTNILNPPMKKIGVVKEWSGDNTSNRPDSITIHIVGSDGSDITKTLTAADNWGGEWLLPAYLDNGTEINYKVYEEDISNYLEDTSSTHQKELTAVTVLEPSETPYNHDNGYPIVRGDRPQQFALMATGDYQQVKSAVAPEIYISGTQIDITQDTANVSGSNIHWGKDITIASPSGTPNVDLTAGAIKNGVYTGIYVDQAFSQGEQTIKTTTGTPDSVRVIYRDFFKDIAGNLYDIEYTFNNIKINSFYAEDNRKVSLFGFDSTQNIYMMAFNHVDNKLNRGPVGVSYDVTLKLYDKAGNPVNGDLQMLFKDLDVRDAMLYYSDINGVATQNGNSDYSGPYAEGIEPLTGVTSVINIREDSTIQSTNNIRFFGTMQTENDSDEELRSAIIYTVKGSESSFRWTGSNCGSKIGFNAEISPYETKITNTPQRGITIIKEWDDFDATNRPTPVFYILPADPGNVKVTFRSKVDGGNIEFLWLQNGEDSQIQYWGLERNETLDVIIPKSFVFYGSNVEILSIEDSEDNTDVGESYSKRRSLNEIEVTQTEWLQENITSGTPITVYNCLDNTCSIYNRNVGSKWIGGRFDWFTVNPPEMASFSTGDSADLGNNPRPLSLSTQIYNALPQSSHDTEDVFHIMENSSFTVHRQGSKTNFYTDIPSDKIILNGGAFNKLDAEDVVTTNSNIRYTDKGMYLYGDFKKNTHYDIPGTVVFTAVDAAYDAETGEKYDTRVTVSNIKLQTRGTAFSNINVVGWDWGWGLNSTTYGYNGKDTYSSKKIDIQLDILDKDGNIVDGQFLLCMQDVDQPGPTGYNDTYSEHIEILNNLHGDLYVPSTNFERIDTTAKAIWPTRSDEGTFDSGFILPVQSGIAFRWAGTACGSGFYTYGSIRFYNVQSVIDHGVIDAEVDGQARPSDYSTYKKGLSPTYTATTAEGYVFKKITVDGVDQELPDGTTWTISFPNISANHRIRIRTKRADGTVEEPKSYITNPEEWTTEDNKSYQTVILDPSDTVSCHVVLEKPMDGYWSDAMTEGVVVCDPDDTVTVTNTSEDRGIITITKTWEDAGYETIRPDTIQFTVVDESGQYSYIGTLRSPDWSTELEVKYSPGMKYYAYETPLENYEADNGPENRKEVVFNGIRGTVAFNNTIKEIPPSRYIVMKIDAKTKEPLPGAVFGLFRDAECTDLVIRGTSQADGRAYLNADPGIYYLKELSAPEGYTYDPTVREVTISAATSGPVTAYTNNTSGVTKVEFSSWQNADPSDIRIKDLTFATAQVTFSKTSGSDDFYIGKGKDYFSDANKIVYIKNPSTTSGKWIKYTWKDAAITADGKTWDVELTMDNITISGYDSGDLGISSDWGDGGHVEFASYSTGTSPQVTCRGTIKISKDGVPVNAQAVNFPVYDIDVSNKSMKESIELLSGVVGTVYLENKTRNGRRYLDISNNGNKFTANGNSVDGVESYYAGFIVSVNPATFSFKWTGQACGTAFTMYTDYPTHDITISNTPIPEVTLLKNWNDNNVSTYRPDSVTFVVEDVQSGDKKEYVANKPDYSVTITDLVPATTDGPNSYKIYEKPIPYYAPNYTESAPMLIIYNQTKNCYELSTESGQTQTIASQVSQQLNRFTITNNLITRKIAIKKIWNDDEELEARPGSLTVHVKIGDTIYDKTVTAADNWIAKFDIPISSSDAEVTGTYWEDVVPDYDAEALAENPKTFTSTTNSYIETEVDADFALVKDKLNTNYRDTTELPSNYGYGEYQRNKQSATDPDSYLMNAVEWTDREAGEGKVTVVARTDSPKVSRALFVFTTCTGHNASDGYDPNVGLTPSVIMSNIMTLIQNYDAVDVIVVNGPQEWASVEASGVPNSAILTTTDETSYRWTSNNTYDPYHVMFDSFGYMNSHGGRSGHMIGIQPTKTFTPTSTEDEVRSWLQSFVWIAGGHYTGNEPAAIRKYLFGSIDGEISKDNMLVKPDAIYVAGDLRFSNGFEASTLSGAATQEYAEFIADNFTDWKDGVDRYISLGSSQSFVSTVESDCNPYNQSRAYLVALQPAQAAANPNAGLHNSCSTSLANSKYAPDYLYQSTFDELDLPMPQRLATIEFEIDPDFNVGDVTAQGNSNYTYTKNGNKIVVTTTDYKLSDEARITVDVTYKNAMNTSTGWPRNILKSGSTFSIDEQTLLTAESPVLSYNIDSKTITNELIRDFELNKTVTQDNVDVNGKLVKIGSELLYTVQFQNPYSREKTYTITDAIPANVELVRILDGGVNTNGTIIWSNIRVPAKGTGSVRFVVKPVGAEKTIINKATVTLNGSTPERNVTKETNEVVNYTPGINKDVSTINGEPLSGKSIKIGDLLTYTITVKNTAPIEQQFTIVDTLPSQLTYVRSSDNGSYTGGKVTWVLGIPGNGEKEVTVVCRAVAEGDISNIVNDMSYGPSHYVNVWSGQIKINKTIDEIYEPFGDRTFLFRISDSSGKYWYEYISLTGNNKTGSVIWQVPTGYESETFTVEELTNGRYDLYSVTPNTNGTVVNNTFRTTINHDNRFGEVTFENHIEDWDKASHAHTAINSIE